MFRYASITIISMFLLLFLFNISVNCQNEDTLELVHVIFRHGNRTASRSYPTDPYMNETYYPFGHGQLTNKGKTTAYRLGKSLRARYDKFLGLIYTPDLVDPVSSSTNRTKMSLELVLAGLFPPKGTGLEWQNELNWQPIPYNYLSSSDHKLSIPVYHCPNYASLLRYIRNSSIGIMLQKTYSDLFRYLASQTCLSEVSFEDVVDIYSTLVSQEDFGLKLPTWTGKVFPKYLEKAIGNFFLLTTSTEELKQLTRGFLLKKIIDDSQTKITNLLHPPGRKLFLYSAHDITIIYVLSAMNVYFSHVPPYGAYVLIEVHKINNISGVLIFYQDYSQGEPRLLKVPGCDYFCPFKQFVMLLKRNLPEGDSSCVDKLPWEEDRLSLNIFSKIR